MWNRYAVAVLMVLVALAAGCTKHYRIQKFPEGEVPLTGALEFEFADSVAPRDSVGIWTTTPYIKFDPPVAGSFKWLRRDLLTFIPAGSGLPPAADITATANPDIAFAKNVRFSPQEMKFHTPYFQAYHLSSAWADYVHADETLPVDIILKFNYPVEAEDLRTHLEIYDNGKRLDPISMYAYGPTSEFIISADLHGDTQGEHHIEAQIKPGLKATMGDAALKDGQSLRDTLNPISELSINTVGAEFHDGAFRVRITGNQGISSKVAATFINLVPDMPFQLRQDGKDLLVESDFRPGAKYGIAIRKNLPGMAGGSLTADYTSAIETPKLKPFIKFASEKGHFLMRNGYENLNVKATNISSLKVRLYEIYENNLLHFLRTNPSNFRRWSYFDSEDAYYYGDDYGYLSIDEYGALIHEDSVAVPAAAENEIVNIPIKLQKQFRNKFKGIFAVEIQSNDGQHWLEDYKIVSLSDLGIIAKWNDDDMLVFVNYLSTGMPASGAHISLISNTNQAFRTAVADANGVVRFDDVGSEWSGNTFMPRLITAQTASDFQFLDFDHTEIDRDRFDIEGKSRENYDVFCYGDRKLYRPGDTLYFSAIVRDWNFGTPKGLPVTVQIKSPEGGSIEEVQKNTNDDGSIELSWPIPEEARTGTYYVDVQSGTTEHYEAYDFEVEDFVPDKIKVQLSATRMSGKPGDTLLFPLQAAYYFGSPCSDHDYSMRYRLVYSDYRSARYPLFNFTEENVAGQNEWSESEGMLDAAGRDTAVYVVPTDLSGTGILVGTASATVWDNTGHTVRSAKTFSISSREHYLGLREHGRYFNLNEQFSLEYVAVNYADIPVKNLKMEVKLERLDWKRAMRRESGSYRYVSESSSLVIRTDTITQMGDVNRFVMKLSDAGNYKLTVKLLDSSSTSRHVEFSAFGRSAATATSFGVNSEGTVAISFDKDNYKVGEKARVLLTTPFSGRMLVTLERDKVHEYRYVDVVNNAAEVVFPIRDGHVPNVWVTATLFRPQKNSGPLPLTVAHGYAGVKVDNPQRNIPIRITAPDQIKPGRTQNISVQAAPGAKVTVAVVDEGILAIDHYRTPDAYTHMYSARELEVRSFDFYAFLLPEVPPSAMATGGSDMGEWTSFAHMNPIRSKRFRPFAYWSGILQADGAGRVNAKVPFPDDFSGRGRIMVMAYDGARFGSGEKGIVVRNDLVMMAAIPRFMTAGDSLTMPVNLMNLTEKAGKTTLKVSLQGPLAATSATEQTVEVPAEGTAVVNMGIMAPKAGAATIILETVGIETQRQRVEIAVRPPSPIITQSGSGTLSAGQRLAFTLPAGFEPEFQQTLVALSPFPALEFADQLDYLLRYPHGCVEQTVSAAFPQLYFPDLAELIAPDKYNSGNAVHHVRDAIKKLESMQLYNGSFSYWLGGDYENPWGTVYATHFLVEARKAGYAVQETVLKRALDRLLENAKESRTFTYTYSLNGKLVSEEKASKELIYSLYVLSLAGTPDLPLMNYYKSHAKALTLDCRYLLGAAFAAQGELRSFEELLPKNTLLEEPQRLTGGSFDSPLRSAGIILNALVEADPGNPRISTMIQYLRSHRQELKTTQENAWVFLGLGKMARSGSGSSVQASLHDGATSLLSYSGQNVQYTSPNAAGKTWTLSATGKGQAYYSWRIMGIRKGVGIHVPPTDNGLTVERSWYDTDGRRIQVPTFNLGELVVCRLKLRANAPVDNVVVSDMIPAGFEVENTRLTKDDYSWIADLSLSPDHLDVRDDRVNVFTSFPEASTRQFDFLVRAVNLGRFLQPAIVAEAMYDQRIRSEHSGQQVRIVDRDAVIPGRSAVAQSSRARRDSLPAVAIVQDSGTIWQRFMRHMQP